VPNTHDRSAADATPFFKLRFSHSHNYSIEPEGGSKQLPKLSKFFIYQLMHKRTALKRLLKFTLKQLLHVSVQSPSSGSALFDHAKVTVVKIIN
jgi:hypothetical protein